MWLRQNNYQYLSKAFQASKLLYAPFSALSCSCGIKSMSSSCCCSFSASFYTMSFNVSCPYPIFFTILLYNKEAVSRTLCSLSVRASGVAATGADTALYNFVNRFLIQLVMFIYRFFGELFSNFMVISKTFIR